MYMSWKMINRKSGDLNFVKVEIMQWFSTAVLQMFTSSISTTNNMWHHILWHLQATCAPSSGVKALLDSEHLQEAQTAASLYDNIGPITEEPPTSECHPSTLYSRTSLTLKLHNGRHVSMHKHLKTLLLAPTDSEEEGRKREKYLHISLILHHIHIRKSMKSPSSNRLQWPLVMTFETANHLAFSFLQSVNSPAGTWC